MGRSVGAPVSQSVPRSVGSHSPVRRVGRRGEEPLGHTPTPRRRRSLTAARSPRPSLSFGAGDATLRRRRRRAQARTHARTHARADARTHARRARAATLRCCGAVPDWRARRRGGSTPASCACAPPRAYCSPSPAPHPHTALLREARSRGSLETEGGVAGALCACAALTGGRWKPTGDGLPAARRRGAWWARGKRRARAQRRGGREAALRQRAEGRRMRRARFLFSSAFEFSVSVNCGGRMTA